MKNIRLSRTDAVRVAVSVILAAVALTLFLMNRAGVPGRPEDKGKQYSATALLIDREVDSIFTFFGVDKSLDRKKLFGIPNSGLFRTERRVLIPKNVLPVQMNLEFNRMARRHNCRAIASENLRENTVTVHIEVGPYILHTIIMKSEAEPRQGVKKYGHAKA